MTDYSSGMCFSLREIVESKSFFLGGFSLHYEDRRAFSLHSLLLQEGGRGPCCQLGVLYVSLKVNMIKISAVNHCKPQGLGYCLEGS